ncbi:hypothetical protein MUP95_03475, partial [bacterium]|nr:hypothetical protein [bacterium]
DLDVAGDLETRARDVADTVEREVLEVLRNRPERLEQRRRLQVFIDENEINEYECHQDYDLITWKYSNSTNSTKIEGKNESNILVFSGKLKGEVINKRVEIDSDPWYQDIMVPLSYVSKTEKEEIAFWLVNADDLKAYKMIATREGIEQIIVNDASVQSINYHISVSGFPSFIWKLETWFRENDSVFVKFDGAISGPFASKTLIELIGE